jgi:DNA processing protein
MTERQALIALNSVSIGSIRLNRLLRFFGTPQRILEQSQSALEAVSGIGPMASQAIRGLREDDVRLEEERAHSSGVRIVVWTESDYPEILRTIPDPPVALYVRGAVPSAPGIAVVGSRRASAEGLKRSRTLASALVREGFTVVSGLARGIDTNAHCGALDAGGTTVAVIGSGFDSLYPPENAALAQRICRQGAVVSEYPMATQPLPQNFPARNRIISGLSRGTLIVEAARNSGALITADCALEQGREVFAVPGEPDRRSSWGANMLIQQGAHVVLDARDITDIIGIHPAAARKIVRAGNAVQERCSSEERKVRDTLGTEPLSLDDIVSATGCAVGLVCGILFSLEMKKEVTRLPGKLFTRAFS